MSDSDTPDEARNDEAPADVIPPADSNDQLRVATEKRNAAAAASGIHEAAGRRKAHADASAADDDGKREARSKAPEGRSTRPVSKS